MKLTLDKENDNQDTQTQDSHRNLFQIFDGHPVNIQCKSMFFILPMDKNKILKYPLPHLDFEASKNTSLYPNYL